VDGSDNIIVEYSVDGTNWITARTLNGSASGTYVDTIPWVPTNNTAFVRFRAEDAIEAGEQARIDNVQLRFVQPLRTANFNLTAGQVYVRADRTWRTRHGHHRGHGVGGRERRPARNPGRGGPGRHHGRPLGTRTATVAGRRAGRLTMTGWLCLPLQRHRRRGFSTTWSP
jgi:hypothetical protein